MPTISYSIVTLNSQSLEWSGATITSVNSTLGSKFSIVIRIWSSISDAVNPLMFSKRSPLTCDPKIGLKNRSPC